MSLPKNITEHKKVLKKTVLVVDDEALATKLLKLILEDNYQVIISGSVDEAEKILQKKCIDLVVSDYQMPNKTGLDLAWSVKSNSSLIPFILITGRGLQEVARGLQGP